MNRAPLKLALALLTRLPVRLALPVRDRDQGQAVAWYPAVGLLVGGLLWLLASGLSGAPGWPAALLVLVAWVALTGALHLDGLADSADAWLGGQGDRLRTLAIMKDPYCGPAGVVALVLVLLGKLTALAVLLPSGQLAAVLLAPLLARAACAGLFLALPYVRENGLASAAARHLPRSAIAAALGLSALLALGAGLVAAIVAALLVFAGGVHLMKQRLGGFTGDTAGALVEAVEVAVLLTAACSL